MAKSLAEQLGNTITLVHVLEPAPTPPGLEAFALEGMPLDWEERLLQGRSGRRVDGWPTPLQQKPRQVKVHWRLLQVGCPTRSSRLKRSAAIC